MVHNLNIINLLLFTETGETFIIKDIKVEKLQKWNVIICV
jgi:hypothetical protein